MNCFIYIKTWLRRLYESKHAGPVPCGVQYKINYQFYIHFKKCCVRYTLNVYYYKSLIQIVYLTTRCRRSCVERQFIMSKRKFQDELDATLAPVLPYLTQEKPRKKGNLSGTSFLPHLVPEEHLMKTDKLPPPPVLVDYHLSI